MTPLSAPRGRFLAALLTIYVVWGSTYLAMRYVVETMPPFLAAGARFLLAGIFLYAVLRARGAPRPSAAQWRGGLVVGGLLLLGGNGGVMWAEQWVASGLAAVLIGTVPLWVAVLEPTFFRGRRPTPMSALAVVLGFGGVALLVAPAVVLRGQEALGVLVLALAAFFWALGSLLSRRVALPTSSLQGTAVQMLMGGLLLVVFGTLIGEWPTVHPETWTTASVLGLLYLVVFGSLIAYSCYVWLLANGSAATVTTYAYVNPLVAVVLGWALADEVLTLRTLIAAAIILASVALLTTLRTRPVPPPATDAPPPMVRTPARTEPEGLKRD